MVTRRSALQGPVAQWLEPAAHNGLVAGSSPAGPTSALAYYRIMRAIKERFLLSLETAKAGKFTLPYRLTFPASSAPS
jgi:hypothetical protein